MVTHATYKLNDSRNAHHDAQRMYQRAYRQGQLAQLWSKLTRRSRNHLWGLAEVESTCTIRDRKSVGRQRVPIRQIRGSWGRCGDFDADFNPLTLHNRERWLSVATARSRGAKLPPIGLIQVGDVYFVQDGHHRVSVAQALGRKEIDAVVTVWDVAGALPWEAQVPPQREEASATNRTRRVAHEPALMTAESDGVTLEEVAQRRQRLELVSERQAYAVIGV